MRSTTSPCDRAAFHDLVIVDVKCCALRRRLGLGAAAAGLGGSGERSGEQESGDEHAHESFNARARATIYYAGRIGTVSITRQPLPLSPSAMVISPLCTCATRCASVRPRPKPRRGSSECSR